ncbi:MAG: NUDIX domain-containing protein [Acidimicrobiales bacterium]
MSEADRYVPPIAEDGLRHWEVAGGIIVRDDNVLLVKNERPGGLIDWSTPGGVVDAGENAIEGLTREVAEETGLVVARWQGPLYRVEVVAPDAGFHLRVEAHLGLEFSGDIVVDDPDGIVVDVAFVRRSEVGRRLDGALPWVVEPLLAHLVEGVDDGRLFQYRMTGARRHDRRVERL